MEYTFIGDVKIPVIGLGTFGMHDDILRNAIMCSVACGGVFFDTAFRYENESEMGDALFNKNAIISSKLSGMQYCGKRKWLYLDGISAKKAYRASCRKLRHDKLDIYMLHSPFRNFEKAYSELIRMKRNNLVGAIGVSGFDVERLNKIKDYCGEYPQFDMIELHPYYSQKSLVDFCEVNGIKVIARSPFAHGEILPELYKDCKLEAMSNKYHKTVPQLVLRWITQQDITVVFRSACEEHIKENCQIFDLTLTEEEMQYFNSLNRNCSYGVRPSEKK